MPKRHRPTLNRRDTLKSLGAAAAATMSVGCGKDSDEPAAPPLEDFDLIRERIDTVVVLMMENRSFDHYFGALSLEEGRTDVDGLTAAISNPHPDGSDVAPFRSSTYCLADPPHSWTSSHEQFNGGANDGFVTEFYDREPAEAHEAMGYFNREDLPTLYTLSDHYALCDQWYASLMTSTQPNRFYLHCAQNNAVTNNDVPIGEDYPSIYTLMADAGHSWGAYYSNLPGVLLVPDRSLGEPQIQNLDAFFAAAEAGTLPNLVLVEPAYGRNDDHPPAHPTAGQIFLSQIYDALASSPQWERILFVITYDEHGGFHDHVAPPTAPDDFADEGFDQLGFRVPTLAIGPWVKPGHVSHVAYDHTSVLAFVEALFGVDPLSKRDAAADPMRDVLDWTAMEQNKPHDPIVLDPIEADHNEIYGPECVTDGSDFKIAPPGTGQPDMERYIREFAAGSRHDVFDQTDELYEQLLTRAQARGLLIRR